MKEYIAYQTVDMEGDVWCNTAFLFESQDKVREFFNSDNDEFVNLFTSPEDRFIHDLEFVDNNPAGVITEITFRTSYSGEVVIKEMAAGYLIM